VLDVCARNCSKQQKWTGCASSTIPRAAEVVLCCRAGMGGVTTHCITTATGTRDPSQCKVDSCSVLGLPGWQLRTDADCHHPSVGGKGAGYMQPRLAMAETSLQVLKHRLGTEDILCRHRTFAWSSSISSAGIVSPVRGSTTNMRLSCPPAARASSFCCMWVQAEALK
jgi:hypothetical protein